ncbi:MULTISPECIES: spermidine synthase [Gammaproteobacteria]|uniref:spermidine synthase n=1 Tax=Gammaproteobacteria TaxID=1236 RepID=UPI000DD04B2F|nr:MULTISPECIES: hypothetical protein [Gammaproteobacteria]RTE85897.1 hypothetical protein DQX04_10655 [Aliidiomarina sp. B3213]TCZ90103.1 hypothetical protein EYQ95_09810 [Lysobacter sp. N42]
MTQYLDAPALENIISSSDIVAFKGNSEVRLVVLENQEYRLLVLNGAVQSIQYKAEPFTLLFPHQRQLLKVLGELPENAQVLEMGLGGGSALAHAQQYFPQMQWTTLERSIDVIDLYLDFFAPQIPHHRHQIVCADAADWLGKNDARKFDLVLCDVYDKIQRPLLAKCAACVANNGWLVVNWLPHLHENTDIERFLEGVPELKGWQFNVSRVEGYRNKILQFQRSE